MPKMSHIEQIIERQARFWEVRRRLAAEGVAPPRQTMAHLSEGPWITISKQWGSGGIELARELAAKLGWQSFDREIVTAISEHTHARSAVMSRLDERAIGSFNDYVAQLLVPHDPGQLAYLQEMVRVIWGLARQGHAVILGRGANWFLDAQFGLRVRVVAPLERRVAKVAEQQKIDRKAAEREVLRHDREQTAFIRQVFDREINDPLGYDLTLNTESLTLETAVEVALGALRRKLG